MQVIKSGSKLLTLSLLFVKFRVLQLDVLLQ